MERKAETPDDMRPFPKLLSPIQERPKTPRQRLDSTQRHLSTNRNAIREGLQRVEADLNSSPMLSEDTRMALGKQKGLLEKELRKFDEDIETIGIAKKSLNDGDITYEDTVSEEEEEDSAVDYSDVLLGSIFSDESMDDPLLLLPNRLDIDAFVDDVAVWWRSIKLAKEQWMSSDLYKYLATVKAEANLTWESLIEFPTDILDRIDAFAWEPTDAQRRQAVSELESVATPQASGGGGGRPGMADIALGIQDPEMRARYEQYLRLRGHSSILRFLSDPARVGDFSQVTKTGDLVGWEQSALSQLTLARNGWHLRKAEVEAFYGDRQVRTLFSQLVARISVGAAASEGLRLNRVLDDVTAETENLIISLCRAQFENRFAKTTLVLKEYVRPPRQSIHRSFAPYPPPPRYAEMLY